MCYVIPSNIQSSFNEHLKVTTNVLKVKLATKAKVHGTNYRLKNAGVEVISF